VNRLQLIFRKLTLSTQVVRQEHVVVGIITVVGVAVMVVVVGIVGVVVAPIMVTVPVIRTGKQVIIMRIMLMESRLTGQPESVILLTKMAMDINGLIFGAHFLVPTKCGLQESAKVQGNMPQ
jgi:hypothetical protein